MACEAEKDPEFFTSISGKLDAMSIFNARCKDVKEAHKVE